MMAEPFISIKVGNFRFTVDNHVTFREFIPEDGFHPAPRTDTVSRDAFINYVKQMVDSALEQEVAK